MKATMTHGLSNEDISRREKSLIGIHNNISNHYYHSGYGLSRSQLLKFRQTPRHFWESCLNHNRVVKEPTPSMLLGSAVHTAVLEPDLFFDEFAIKPECDRRTKEGKEIYNTFAAQCIGRRIITQEQYEIVLNIRKVVLQEHKELIEGAKIEHSIYWEQFGTLCKARPDIWHDDVIVDLKTTNNADPRYFKHELYDYGYHVQAAMIQDAILSIMGKKISTFVMLCVETHAPYLTATHIISDQAIIAGREEYQKHLREYQRCVDTNTWPGYSSKIIDLPNFVNYL